MDEVDAAMGDMDEKPSVSSESAPHGSQELGGEPQVIRVLHAALSQLPAARFLRVSESLRSCGEVRVGTAFSGCEIFSNVLDTMFEVFNTFFGSAVSARLTFMAESRTDKQQFLIAQHKDVPLYADVKDLTCPSPKDVRSGLPTPVPAVDWFAAGFTCVSRSKNNSKNHTHKDCVQKGSQSIPVYLYQSTSIVYIYISPYLYQSILYICTSLFCPTSTHLLIYFSLYLYIYVCMYIYIYILYLI